MSIKKSKSNKKLSKKKKKSKSSSSSSSSSSINHLNVEEKKDHENNNTFSISLSTAELHNEYDNDDDDFPTLDLYDINDENPDHEIIITKEQQQDHMREDGDGNNEDNEGGGFGIFLEDEDEEEYVDISNKNLFNVKSKEERDEEERQFREFIKNENEKFFELKEEYDDNINKNRNNHNQKNKYHIPDQCIHEIEKMGKDIGLYECIYGESQFEAVSDSVYGVVYHARNIRYEVVNWLKEHSDYQRDDGRNLTFLINTIYDDDDEGDGDGGGDSWLSYCKEMMKYYRTEGDMVTLTAIAEVMNMKITLTDFREMNRIETEIFQPKERKDDMKKCHIVCWREEGGKILYTNVKICKRYCLIIKNDYPEQFIPVYSHASTMKRRSFDDLERELSEEIDLKTKVLKNLDDEEMKNEVLKFAKALSVKKNLESVIFMFFGLGYSTKGKNFLIPFEDKPEIVEREYKPASLIPVNNILKIFSNYVKGNIPKVFIFDACRKVNEKSCLQKFRVATFPKNSFVLLSNHPGRFSIDDNPFVKSIIKNISTPNKNLYQILTNIKNDSSASRKQIAFSQESHSLKKNGFSLLKKIVLNKKAKVENIKLTNFTIMRKFLITEVLNEKNFKKMSRQAFLYKQFEDYKKNFIRSQIVKEYRYQLNLRKRNKQKQVKLFIQREKSVIDYIISLIQKRNLDKLAEFLEKKSKKFLDMKSQFSNLLKEKRNNHYDSFQVDCISKFNSVMMKNLEKRIEKELRLNLSLIEFKSFNFDILKENLNFSDDNEESGDEVYDFKKKCIKFYFDKLKKKIRVKRMMENESVKGYVLKEKKIYSMLIQNLFNNMSKMIKEQNEVELSGCSKQAEKKLVNQQYSAMKKKLKTKLQQRKKFHDKFFKLYLKKDLTEARFNQTVQSLCHNKENYGTIEQFILSEKVEKFDDLKTLIESEFDEYLTYIKDLWSEMSECSKQVEKISLGGKKLSTANINEEIKNELFSSKNVRVPPKLERTLSDPNSLVKYGLQKSKSPRVSKKHKKKKLSSSKKTKKKSSKKIIRPVSGDVFGHKSTKKRKNLEDEVEGLMNELGLKPPLKKK